MAETKKAKAEEKKKVRITPEVDVQLEKIEKNINFGKENNCEADFQEGGKYYGAFMKLVRETAILAGTQLREAMEKTLPSPERRPEFKATVKKLQANALNNGFEALKDAFSKADVDQIKKVYKEIFASYCDAYSAEVMPIKDLVA